MTNELAGPEGPAHFKEKSMLNAIVYSVLAGATFAFGPGFLGYFALTYAGSHIAGAYCEDKINEYDRAIRRKAKEVSGNEQPGDAVEYGELVRKTTTVLGPFIPALPVITACAGAHFAHKAKMVRSGEEYRRRASKRLPKGFSAPGKFVY